MFIEKKIFSRIALLVCKTKIFGLNIHINITCTEKHIIWKHFYEYCLVFWNHENVIQKSDIVSRELKITSIKANINVTGKMEFHKHALHDAM